jgi:protein-S-isoprenylcysteine O-methyltransferase Ste14
VLEMNDRIKILLLMIFYTPIVLIIFGALILVPANDFAWLEGWMFIILFVTYIMLYMLYSLIKDPELLMKRGKYTTDDPETTFIPDKLFFILSLPVFGFTFIFPGFDYALNLSQLPWFIKLIGFIGIIIGFIGMTYVNMINRYASKGLVIHKDHELITTGPYQYVRHPMYAIIIIFCSCIPLGLGSFIAFIVSLLFPLLLVYRIRIEEKMLMDHLIGYKEYMEQVPYRLIPKLY